MRSNSREKAPSQKSSNNSNNKPKFVSKKPSTTRKQLIIQIIIQLLLIGILAGIIYQRQQLAEWLQSPALQGGSEQTQDQQFQIPPNIYPDLFLLTLISVILLFGVKTLFYMGFSRYSQSYSVEQITPQEFDRQTVNGTRQETLKLQNSAQYQFLVNLKGKALTEWNWQSKESSEQRPHRQESDQAQANLQQENNDQLLNLEEEFEKIDKELEETNGYYFSPQINGKSSATKRRNPSKATPSTHGSMKGDIFDEL